jgi:hypothetical protein
MKKKLNNLISLFRRHYIFSLSLLAIVTIFGLPAQAGLMDAVMSVLASIFGLFSWVVGSLLSFLLEILVNVAQFNDFIYVTPVVYGWVVVRDVCNMFFIVVLLIIAFATILQVNGYDYKKDVPKLVIAAILINFSKMFAGLMIDVSQVIMLTFVNAFAANGANNLALAFQIQKYNSFAKAFTASSDNSFQFKLLLAAIAGFAAACIATVIVVVMMIALVMRIVMLWIYVILSPLPYLLSTFQKGKSYADKWWGEFSKELIGGPVLAFFLWLALTVAKMPDSDLIKNGTTTSAVSGYDASSSSLFLSGGTDLFTNGPFQKYLIVIGLMVGGLKIAGEAGGTMGTWAKKGSAWVNSGQKLAWSGTKMGADFLNRKVAGGWGKDGKFGTGIDLNVGRQIDRLKRGFTQDKKDDLEKINKAAFRNLQMGGVVGGIAGFTSDDWYDNYWGLSGIKRVALGGLYGENNRAGYNYEEKNKLSDAAKIEAKISEMPMSQSEYSRRYKVNNESLADVEKQLQDGDFTAKFNAKTAELTGLNNELIQSEAVIKNKENALKKDPKNQTLIDEIEHLKAEKEQKEAKIERVKTERADIKSEEENLKESRKELQNNASELNNLVSSGGVLSQDKYDEQVGPMKAEAERLRAEAAKAGKKASFLATSDQYYQTSLRSAQAEGKKRVGETDNEDEGLVALKKAEARGDTMGMAAIVKQMAKIGGMNSVLAMYGYNASAGMSEKHLAEMTEQLKAQGKTDDEIKQILKKNAGFNDFMRDMFGKKMGNKAMMALQSDISSIAEGGSHQYMAKTVAIDEKTKELGQVSGRERAGVIVGERRKQENEGNIRKFGRFGYGDELLDEGFQWNEEGMTTFIDNLALVAKEIKGTRFNRNAATKIVGGDGTLDELARALKAIEKQGMLPKSDNYKSADGFIAMLKNYARGAAGEEAKRVSKIVHDSVSNKYI